MVEESNTKSIHDSLNDLGLARECEVPKEFSHAFVNRQSLKFYHSDEVGSNLLSKVI